MLENLHIEDLSLNEDVNKRKRNNFQVEVRLKKTTPKSEAMNRIEEFVSLANSLKNARNWKSANFPESVEITNLIEKMIVGTCQMEDGEKIEINVNSKNIHFYKLNTDGPLSQNLDEEENIVGSQLWRLPCVEFENIWENLIYDSQLKNEIMSYVYALIHLSEKHVNSKIISVNRLILLVGPPGTGKTSLCKGLAQHLAIRLNDRYTHSVMVEINSHSLFSKWFSESGKLVQKMFDQIDELADDPSCMVFVLIDEVESLGMCREASGSRAEPADAIRAVNALLTQIDRIRRRDNVLIVCTSNLETSLDRALVDRADIVRHVGEPSTLALFAMLKSCILEMMRIGVVQLENDEEIPDDIMSNEKIAPNSQSLFAIAQLAHGLSGRAISMLPTLVYSKSLDETLSLTDCLNLFSVCVAERKMRKK